jgi:hypothetical protein
VHSTYWRSRTMHNLRNLLGQCFGRLTVLSRAPDNTRAKRARWICSCSCGKQTIVSGNSLLRGNTRSCGCLRKEEVSRRRKTHGYTRTGTYLSYRAARSRCENVHNANFLHYGGRGIKFLFKSFEHFLAEMGERPEGKSLERIDNDGHYEASNCCWDTRLQQCNNKRSNRRVTAFRQTCTIASWSRETGISPGLIGARLKAGWSPEKALTQHIRGRALSRDSHGCGAAWSRARPLVRR